MSMNEWFGEWFDSPYYHILYKGRDRQEARFFLDNLIAYLKPKPEAKFLDLACGQGRHAIYLNEKGYDVTGIDLSEKNIESASEWSNDRLRFVRHDMRESFEQSAYDYVLNLFTSFGYFKTKEENQQSIDAVAGSLKPGGKFVLDFLNPYAVINGLVPEEVKHIEGINFHITRTFDGEYILKDIAFEHEGKSYLFQERVKAIRRLEFLAYFEQANLRVVDCFGDYQLNAYDQEKSTRLIFVTSL